MPQSTPQTMDRIGAEIQSEKMGTPNERVIVAVATPLQPELAQRIAAVDGRVEVRYAQRWPAWTNRLLRTTRRVTERLRPLARVTGAVPAKALSD
jgi:hypothetical protein